MEPETLALTLPIRRLVEFLLRTGSIDSRFTGFDRALEGARACTASCSGPLSRNSPTIRRRYPSGSNAAVPVFATRLRGVPTASLPIRTA